MRLPARLPMHISRRSQHLLLSRPLWNRRLWFLGGAFLVGSASIAFALGASWANGIFQGLLAWNRALPLLLTPLAFAAIAWCTQRFFPGAQGSGIPQTIAALSASAPVRARLLSPKIALGKVGLTIAGLLAGASIGREGPTVQIGAALMYSLSRSKFFPYERMHRGLILAGGAAGVAAAFNAPLAGVVFAIEEMSRSFEHRTVGIVITAVIVAGVISLAVLGDYAYFGRTSTSIDLALGWKAVLACGLLGGLAGGGFSRLLIWISTALPPRLVRLGRLGSIGFAAACGLLLALLGLVSGGTVYGTGYDEARGLLVGHSSGYSYGVLKLAATLVSYASGIPGGIFAPSLAVGAGLGADLQVLLPDAPAATLVLLGMVGYFSGVVQVPLTAFVIVLEMTGDAQLALPLMACAFIAYTVSRTICPHSLYKSLARPFKAMSLPRPAATP
jgi:H+/Cl- antiporter ClcA